MSQNTLFDIDLKKPLQIPDLCTTNILNMNTLLHCRFYDTLTDYEWYVIEANKQTNGDYIFYGLHNRYKQFCAPRDVLKKQDETSLCLDDGHFSLGGIRIV